MLRRIVWNWNFGIGLSASSLEKLCVDCFSFVWHGRPYLPSGKSTVFRRYGCCQQCAGLLIAKLLYQIVVLDDLRARDGESSRDLPVTI